MDLSLSPSINNYEPDQTLSGSNNGDCAKCSSKEYISLMNELQTKTDKIISAIGITKTIDSKSAPNPVDQIHINPLNPSAYDNINDFIDSIDNVFKWYEAKKQQQQATIISLVNGIALVSDEKDKKIKEMEQMITEQHNTINGLKQTLAAAEDEKRKKDADAGVADINKENELCKTQLIYEEEIKSLTNQITALKKENEDLHQNTTKNRDIDQNDYFVELKDVVIAGSCINYRRLKGKVLLLDKVHHFNAGSCFAYYYKGDNECSVKIEFDDSFKIRLNGELGIAYRANVKGLVCSWKHIDSFELKYLQMGECHIVFEQFLELIRSQTLKILVLNGTFIHGEFNCVLVEKVLEYLPNVKEFKCTFHQKNNCNNETASNLCKLPTFMNLQKFELRHCSHDFDLETFGKFMEKHYWVEFTISVPVYLEDVECNASKELIDKLEADKEAILSFWPNSSPKPLILFDAY